MRDRVVVAAFGVVLGTLPIQGPTPGRLMRAARTTLFVLRRRGDLGKDAFPALESR